MGSSPRSLRREGLAIGHRVELPFLYDFAAYTRFLVAVPLLILAEGIEGQMAAVAAHFVKSGPVPERTLPEFPFQEGSSVNAASINYTTLKAAAALKRLKELESLSPPGN